MTSPDKPLVTIVSPVYNGVQHLRAAVASVLAQDYPNWRYVIADNKSTDGTAELAEELAKQDPRISVFHGDTFVDIMGNWNRAMRQVPPESEFCALLCVDDVYYPEFISRMVEAGQQSPRVGIIGCYRLEGPLIWPQGVGDMPPVISGREAARLHMSRTARLFACPSTMMYRAELVRARPEFYHHKYLHADVSVCYEALQQWDFAFAQRLLVYTMMHDDSITATKANRLGTIPLEEALMVHEFGPDFFAPHELPAVTRKIENRYYRELVKRLMLPKRRDLIAFHEKRWAEINRPFRRRGLLRAAVLESFGWLTSLPRRLRGMLRREPAVQTEAEPPISRSDIHRKPA